MGTNVTTDGQREMQAITDVLKYLEDLSIYGTADRKTRLANEFFSYCKTHDSERSARFKLIPGKFKDEFEERLQEENMPYAVMADNYGNYAFLTRDIDEEKFYEIQEDIFRGHPEYHKELTAEMYLTRQERKYSDVLKMTFKSEEEFEMFRNKSYEKGKGFVIASEKEGDNYVVYASLKDGCADGFNADIPSTILRMQADLCGGGAELKKQQVRYDMGIMDDALDRMEHGEEFVIINSYDNRDTCIECVNGKVTFMEYDGKSQCFQPRSAEISMPENWKDEKEVAAFKNAMSVHMAKIKNKQIMLPEQFRSFQALSPSELAEKSYKEQCKAFESNAKGNLRPVATNEFLTKYAKDTLLELEETKRTLAAKRAEFNDFPTDELKAEIKALKEKKDILSEKYVNVLGFKNHKAHMDKAIESVIDKVHADLKRTSAYQNASGRGGAKLREEMLEEAIIDCIKNRGTKELVALETFLNKNGKENDYQTLLDAVKDQYDNNINPERIDKLLEAKRGKDVDLERGAEKTNNAPERTV